MGTPAIVATPSTTWVDRWEPLASIALLVGSRGSFELSYTYRFNTERIQSSTSQIVVGLWY